MNLNSFLTSRGITARDCAQDIGCSEARISQIVAGDTNLSAGLARRICAWSGGVVTLNALLGVDDTAAAPEKLKRGAA